MEGCGREREGNGSEGEWKRKKGMNGRTRKTGKEGREGKGRNEGTKERRNEGGRARQVKLLHPA